MSRFLQHLKEPVARKARCFSEGQRASLARAPAGTRMAAAAASFLAAGVGYDRNITTAAALRALTDYMHANPVRRGLVDKPEDWEWSSARWYTGLRPVKIEMDDTVNTELARDGVLDMVARRTELGEIKC
jgi:putative transposase